jgi:HemY protein
MKKTIKFFLFLTLGITIGYLIHLDSGAIRIDYYKTTIITPFWVGMLILVLTFFALHVFLNLIRFSFNIKKIISVERRWRLISKQKKLLEKGLKSLAQGQWSLAENHFNNGIKKNTDPCANYIGLLKATEAQGIEYSEQKLKKLEPNLSQTENLAVSLAQAKLYLLTHQHKKAQALLHGCLKICPSNPYTYSLLYEALCKQKKWDDIELLLPKFKKYKALCEKEMLYINEEIAKKTLLLVKNNPQQLQRTWSKLPKDYRLSINTLTFYCQLLSDIKHHNLAKSLITKNLKKSWDPMLLECFAHIAPNNDIEALLLAETWLTNHPDDPDLLSALGILSQKNKMLAKSEQYFKRSQQTNPTRKVLLKLAEVSLLNNKPLEAINYYKKHADQIKTINSVIKLDKKTIKT